MMENLFKPGEIVYARNPPNIKLIVRRFVDEVYFCKVFNHPGNIERAYSEKDLRVSTNPTELRHF
ncbi:MAG: hypothetical protein ACFHWX_12820 [Bacteroidota bacterium]